MLKKQSVPNLRLGNISKAVDSINQMCGGVGNGAIILKFVPVIQHCMLAF